MASGTSGCTFAIVDESLLEPSMAWALLRTGLIQLIDIRRRDGVGAARVKGARPIPLDELPAELATLDRERPVVLMSLSGRTAADIVRVLRSAGGSARTVEGGLRAWLDAGLPVDRGAASEWQFLRVTESR